jgi:hypothetical protein
METLVSRLNLEDFSKCMDRNVIHSKITYGMLILFTKHAESNSIISGSYKPVADGDILLIPQPISAEKDTEYYLIDTVSKVCETYTLSLDAEGNLTVCAISDTDNFHDTVITYLSQLATHLAQH